jgi:hypothetical protein
LKGSAVTQAWVAVRTQGFILNTLGLGLLVSTVVTNQQQAMVVAAFVPLLPMIYPSGRIVPIENMPVPIQWFNVPDPRPPLHDDHPRHLPEGRRARRGAVARGADPAADGRVAASRFRKRLD